MGGPHKHNPIPFRPGVKPGDPDGDRDWLAAYATETGRPVSAIVSEAVAEYREKVDFARSVAARTANREIAVELRGARTPETTETEGETDA